MKKMHFPQLFPRTPAAVLNRLQIEPGEQFPVILGGMRPSQLKNAVILADSESGWVDVYWISLEAGKNTKHWRSMHGFLTGLLLALLMFAFWATYYMVMRGGVA